MWNKGVKTHFPRLWWWNGKIRSFLDMCPALRGTPHGLMLCCDHLEMLNNFFLTRASVFSFCAGLHKWHSQDKPGCVAVMINAWNSRWVYIASLFLARAPCPRAYSVHPGHSGSRLKVTHFDLNCHNPHTKGRKQIELCASLLILPLCPEQITWPCVTSGGREVRSFPVPGNLRARVAGEPSQHRHKMQSAYWHLLFANQPLKGKWSRSVMSNPLWPQGL